MRPRERSKCLASPTRGSSSLAHSAKHSRADRFRANNCRPYCGDLDPSQRSPGGHVYDWPHQAVRERAGLQMTRILIADEHCVVRAGVRRIVEDNPKWSVVAEAARRQRRHRQGRCHQARRGHPRLLATSHRRHRSYCVKSDCRVPNVEVLIFTMHNNENLLRDIVKAGARGYVLKSDTQQHLISAIQALAAHKSYFSDGVSQALLEPS